MTQAKQGDTVKVHYTGKLDDGTVFDSSLERDPLEFTIGENRLIPGFEEAVVGMNVGDSKTATIPEDQAFGPYRDELVKELDKSRVPEGMEPKVGDSVEIRQQDGSTIPVKITGVSDSSVTLDANHPLAGKDLTFEIQLVDIV